MPHDDATNEHGSNDRGRRIERQLRAILLQCMADADDPYSEEGEAIVYRNWLSPDHASR